MELCEKKERNLSELEKISLEYGDTWIWCSFDPVHKIFVALVVGRRIKINAVRLIAKTKEVVQGGIIPFFTSDELRHYPEALLQVYGVKEKIQSAGKRGRPRKPKISPPRELNYAQVVKNRRKGRVVSITTKVIFGVIGRVKTLLEKSRVSKSINTAFVERSNGILRESNRRLTRKTHGFSKRREELVNQLNLFLGYYHFARSHGGLQIKCEDGYRKWLHRTPAMAIGVTDHIWTVKELLTFKLPP